MTTTATPATELLDLIEQDVFRLREAWHVFRFLFATKKMHVDVLNAAGPGFFGSIQRMMLDDVILQVCRITDPAANRSQENATLRRVLAATNWKETDPGRWERFCQQLDFVDASCLDCRAHRNKRISHVALTWSTRALTLPGATLAMVDRAVNSIQAFIESIYHELHRGVSRSFDLPDLGRDVERFIEYLLNRASQIRPDAAVIIRYTPGDQFNTELECPFCGSIEWVSFYPNHDPIHKMTTRAHFDGCHGVVGFETIRVTALDRTGLRRPISFTIDLSIKTRDMVADV